MSHGREKGLGGGGGADQISSQDLTFLRRFLMFEEIVTFRATAVTCARSHVGVSNNLRTSGHLRLFGLL